MFLIVEAISALAARAAGAAVGVAVSLAVPLHQKLVAVALAVPATGCAIIAVGVVAYILDDGDLKAVLAWARRSQATVVTASGTAFHRATAPFQAGPGDYVRRAGRVC